MKYQITNQGNILNASQINQLELPMLMNIQKHFACGSTYQSNSEKSNFLLESFNCSYCNAKK